MLNRTPAYKVQAIALMSANPARSVISVAESLGLKPEHYSNLYRWRHEIGLKGPKTYPAGNASPFDIVNMQKGTVVLFHKPLSPKQAAALASVLPLVMG